MYKGPVYGSFDVNIFATTVQLVSITNQSLPIPSLPSTSTTSAASGAGLPFPLRGKGIGQFLGVDRSSISSPISSSIGNQKKTPPFGRVLRRQSLINHAQSLFTLYFDVFFDVFRHHFVYVFRRYFRRSQLINFRQSSFRYLLFSLH